MVNQPDYETKAASSDVALAIDDLVRAFEAFKETNDQRLDEIERRQSADVVTEEKLARIDRALDAQRRAVDGLALKAARPEIGGRPTSSRGGVERKAAFEMYVRSGDKSSLRGLEAKSTLTLSTDSDGGYLVPDETEVAINAAVRDISPIRSIAGVRQVSASVYKKPFATTGAETGWVGETAARAGTDTPTLAELSFPTMELYAMPAATQSLLDDSAVDIDAWIAEEVRAAFAEQEGTAFVTGDGTNKPKGFMAYETVDNASWVWGKIGTISTGAAGAFPATDPANKLIDLIYSVKASYRANATFVMNRTTQAAVRKLKDGDGNYVWQPAVMPGQAPTLMGFAIAEAEDMPDIETDESAIAFGDFRRGYLIVDRVGIRVLRDPFSSKPYVLFYTTKRVGGGVQDFDAIKLLKFGA